MLATRTAALAALLALAGPVTAQATFTVTKTFDDGSAGTLRWAIDQVNAANTSNTAFTINFGVPAGSTILFATSGANADREAAG